MTGGVVVATAILLVFGVASPRTCSALFLSGETATALDAVRKCPRAIALLGADPQPSWIGCASGESESGCDSGSGEWSLPVSGARARGSLEISTTKHRSRGWVADGVTLEVGDVRVDVIACKDVPIPD
jgi:hypothetical protein